MKSKTKLLDEAVKLYARLSPLMRIAAHNCETAKWYRLAKIQDKAQARIHRRAEFIGGV